MLEGAAKQIGPKFMTVATMAIGLFPILWSTGTGADLMKRIAVPMVGGLASSFVMELLVYPVVYTIWRQREMSRWVEVAAWRGRSLLVVPGAARQ